MKKLILLLFIVMAAVSASAQTDAQSVSLRKFVVADMETRVPIRSAYVITNTGYRDTTNYRGVCYLPAQFDTVIVYKPNYLSEKLAYKEVTDSTYLLAKNHALKEVTVWGKDRQKELDENVSNWGAAAAAMGAAEAPKGIVSFDVAKMLDRRGRRDRKNLRKTKAAFKEMDSKGKNNPVEAAYKDMKEEEQRQADLVKQRQEAAQRREALKEDNAQNLVNNYEKVADQQQKTVDETAPSVDSLKSVLLDGINEDTEAYGGNASYRHTYYYKADADSLEAALADHRLTLLQNEQSYRYVTVELGRSWETRIKNIIDKELSADERTKLAEQNNALIIQLHLTQGGRVLLAKLRFLDPYQGVTTFSSIRTMLDDLRSVRLSGLETVPADSCFIMSFTYHE
jgi:hypothetical protein